MSPHVPAPHSPLLHRPPRPHQPPRGPRICPLALCTISAIALCWALARSVLANPAHDDGELAHLQRQALRHALLDARSQRSLWLSLRLSALLPQIRATVGRGTQWVYSTRGDSYNEPVQDGDRITYSLSASWDLARLLFTREEIVLRREAQRAAGRRSHLLLQVADLYARRCQLEARRRNTPPQTAAADRLASQAAALDIALSAASGDEAHGPLVTHCPAQPPAPLSRPQTASRPRVPPADTDASDYADDYADDYVNPDPPDPSAALR